MENTGGNENSGRFSAVGRMITSVVFLVLIYILFFGMLMSGKEIAGDFSAAYAADAGNVMDKIAAGITSAETTIDKSIAGKSNFIDVHGLFQVMLGRKLIEESRTYYYVYKMDNGQLTYAYKNYGTNWIVNQFKTLKKACEKQNTELLYVQWPYKVDKYDNQLPHGMEDYSNQNADRLVAGLEKAKIATLDYREVLHELHGSGEAYSSLFFKTDHHWTTETAFEAYVYLLKYLSENYGYEYDPMVIDENNFVFEHVEDCFIGSLANRSGKLYAGVDGFTYVYPKFDTDFIWEKYGKSQTKLLTREGSFYETLFFETVKEDPDIAKPYRDNCYFNGNPALVKITNNKVEKGKVLFVCDSYSKPIVSFLSLALNHIEFMDLRDFTKTDLVDYVQDNDFELVIVAYNVYAIKPSTAAGYKFKTATE